MRRIGLTVVLALGLTVAPLLAVAQTAGKVYRIGLLGTDSPSAQAKSLEGLRAGLRDLGYVEGENIVIEYRWAEGQTDRLASLAAELVALKVDLIVTSGGTPPALAAKQATTIIPIVTSGVGDAVGIGLVASLARPGVTSPA
jgi:putative tryptophan/tyrosine transport system substrate-binding protein